MRRTITLERSRNLCPKSRYIVFVCSKLTTQDDHLRPEQLADVVNDRRKASACLRDDRAVAGILDDFQQ